MCLDTCKQFQLRTTILYSDQTTTVHILHGHFAPGIQKMTICLQDTTLGNVG